MTTEKLWEQETGVAFPRVEQMHGAHRAIARMVNSNSAVLLASMQNNVEALNECMMEAHNFVFEQVTFNLAALNLHHWGKVDQTLNDMGPGPDREELEGELVEDANSDFSNLKELYGQIDDKIRGLSNVESPDLASLKDQLLKQGDEIAKAVEENKQKIDQLNRRRQDLSEALNALKSPSVLERFGGLIPTKEEVNAAVGLVSGKIDKDLLAMIVDKVNSGIGELSAGKSYMDVYNARNALDVELESVQRVQASKLKEQRKNSETFAAHEQVGKMFELREQWLIEARNLNGGFAKLLLNLKGQSDLDVLSTGLQRVAGYFGTIRKLHEAL